MTEIEWLVLARGSESVAYKQIWTGCSKIPFRKHCYYMAELHIAPMAELNVSKQGFYSDRAISNSDDNSR